MNTLLAVIALLDFYSMKIRISVVTLASLCVIFQPISPDIAICIPMLLAMLLGAMMRWVGFVDIWLFALLSYHDAIVSLTALFVTSVTLIIIMFIFRVTHCPLAGCMIMVWFFLRSRIWI